MRGVIQNSVRPIAVYVIDIQTDRVVSDAVITQPSGVFDLGPLQPAAYAVVFRVSFDPQFPLDYVEAVAPSVAVVQELIFRSKEILKFFPHLTMLPMILLSLGTISGTGTTINISYV